MLKYEEIKPSVYIETTVVSYLAARPSADGTLSVRQRVTRQFWENYSDNFEFIVSDVVITEIRQGDEIAAQRRVDALAGLTVLELSPEAVIPRTGINKCRCCTTTFATGRSTYCYCCGKWHRVPNLLEL